MLMDLSANAPSGAQQSVDSDDSTSCPEWDLYDTGNGPELDGIPGDRDENIFF